MKPARTWVEVTRDSEAWPLYTTSGLPLLPSCIVQWMHTQRIKVAQVPPSLTNGDIFRYCELISVSNRVFYKFSSPKLAMLFKLSWS